MRSKVRGGVVLRINILHSSRRLKRRLNTLRHIWMSGAREVSTDSAGREVCDWPLVLFRCLVVCPLLRALWIMGRSSKLSAGVC